jgi:Complex 1 protein (LYR family)
MPTSSTNSSTKSEGTSTTSSKHLTHQVRRKEVLSLYREVLRTAKHFHWADRRGPASSVQSAIDQGTQGRPWNEILKEAARKEFEVAKNETDPLIIARLLVTGRDCVQQIQNKFNEATSAAWTRIVNERSKN